LRDPFICSNSELGSRMSWFIEEINFLRRGLYYINFRWALWSLDI